AYVGAVLARERDIAIVGEAHNPVGTVAQALDLVPDVVLLDLGMASIGGGRRGGIEAAWAISNRVPATKVVMLTGSAQEADVYEALQAGACGYVVKGAAAGDLVGVVRTMAHNLGVILPPAIGARMLTPLTP